MKKIGFTLTAIFLLSSGLFSQTVDDALRYSQLFYGGSARFMSMGGAFTALGGDMSSLSQNPAGIGVFRSSEFSITPQLDYISATAGFHGNTSDYLYNFNLGQVGFVSAIRMGRKEDNPLKFNFGYTFNKTSNLHQTVRIEGINNSSSMADYWADNANRGINNDYTGTYYQQLTGPEGIAFDTYVIDSIPGRGGQFYSGSFSKYGQTVTRLITNDGFTGEHALSFGGNYLNKVYFGATFGISQLRYVSQYMHSEEENPPYLSTLRNFSYSDYYEDRGTGYSFKLGAVIKPIDAVRIGIAFHSPVWYRIDEYFYESISANYAGETRSSSNDPLRFNYALATPFRLLAGIGVQIQKFALLSADYERVDYSMAKFSQTGDGFDYSNTNDKVKQVLKVSNNFRLGAEFRLNKLYLRGGYAYYGKPYRSGDDNANLDYNSFSTGIGFRERNFSLDLGYTYLTSSQVYVLYPGSADANPPFDAAKANITTNQNMINMTFAFRF